MRDQLKFLLIQVRDYRDSIMRQHERECLLKQLRIHPDQLHVLNVFEQPLQTTAVHGFDAVLIGGSGHCSVTQDYPFYPVLKELLHYTVKRCQPVFGLCWGYQFMALAFGGQVEKQIHNKEVGTFEIYKTPEAELDPIFSQLPSPFWAHLGHTDFVTALGSEMVNLSYTRDCAFQALKHKQSPLYGAQFHPELDKDALIYRIDFFRGDYVDEGVSMDDIKRELKDTPNSCLIMDYFVNEQVIPYHQRRLI